MRSYMLIRQLRVDADQGGVEQLEDGLFVGGVEQQDHRRHDEAVDDVVLAQRVEAGGHRVEEVNRLGRSHPLLPVLLVVAEHLALVDVAGEVEVGVLEGELADNFLRAHDLLDEVVLPDQVGEIGALQLLALLDLVFEFLDGVEGGLRRLLQLLRE